MNKTLVLLNISGKTMGWTSLRPSSTHWLHTLVRFLVPPTQSPVTRTLDHENAYVRVSVAAALAEAVEQWSQSASQTIKTLCGLYREKVGLPRVYSDGC